MPFPYLTLSWKTTVWIRPFWSSFFASPGPEWHRFSVHFTLSSDNVNPQKIYVISGVFDGFVEYGCLNPVILIREKPKWPDFGSFWRFFGRQLSESIDTALNNLSVWSERSPKYADVAKKNAKSEWSEREHSDSIQNAVSKRSGRQIQFVGGFAAPVYALGSEIQRSDSMKNEVPKWSGGDACSLWAVLLALCVLLGQK